MIALIDQKSRASKSDKLSQIWVVELAIKIKNKIINNTNCYASHFNTETKRKFQAIHMFSASS